MNAAIPHLRTFFRISNATFESVRLFTVALGGNPTPSKMEQLHKLALVEIEKEEPDLTIMDHLLSEMELCAGKNTSRIPDYPKGAPN